ncbi:unnamed protein product, partial [Polarella glacialis]
MKSLQQPSVPFLPGSLLTAQTAQTALLCLEGLAYRWVPFLGSSDVGRLVASCRNLQAVAGSPSLWAETSQQWCYTRSLWDASLPPKEAPWRRICALQERLWNAWRGAPVSVRLAVRQELRQQKIADLEVILVEFLAGEEGLVLGHSGGAVSTWELRPQESTQVSSKLDALVLGVFQTSRKYDVQDLAVSPPASSQPAALLLGKSVWLAAAVGPSAYIWESSGTADPERPMAALASWELRGT